MSKPHKVFGIGLNKTGTSSPKRALVTLGYNHCDRSGQLTHKYFNDQTDRVFDAVEEFDSFEDWSWPLMYKQVFEKYGKNARYILTRSSSSQAWLKALNSILWRPTPIIIRENAYSGMNTRMVPRLSI